MTDKTLDAKDTGHAAAEEEAEFVAVPCDQYVEGPLRAPIDVIKEVLEDGRKNGWHVTSTISAVVIAVRHMRHQCDTLELLRMAAQETGIPLLEAGNTFWWPPARGETSHPTAEEFLRSVAPSHAQR